MNEPSLTVTRYRRPAAPRAGLLAAVAVALVVVLAACGDDGTGAGVATSQVPATQKALEAHDWLLDPGGSSPAIPGNATTTIAFSGAQASGNAPCNSYRASVTLDGTAITIGNVAATLRGCDQPVMDAETAYFAALAKVNQVQVNDLQLTLRGPGVTMSFSAIDAAKLLAGPWEVTSIGTDTAITSVLLGTQPTLTFDETGNVSIKDGCNTATATYHLDGSAITFQLGASTMKACDTPPGLQQQDADLLAALSVTESLDVQPGSLTLFDQTGRIKVTAMQPSTQS